MHSWNFSRAFSFKESRASDRSWTLQAAGFDLKIYGDPQMSPGPRDIEENRGEAVLLQDRAAEGLDLVYKFLVW